MRIEETWGIGNSALKEETPSRFCIGCLKSTNSVGNKEKQIEKSNLLADEKGGAT